MDPIRFMYVYDFGDDWLHSIEFERLLVLEPAPRRASCIDGARAIASCAIATCAMHSAPTGRSACISRDRGVANQ